MTYCKFFQAILLTSTLLAGSAGATSEPYVDSSSILWEAAPGYQFTLTVSGDGKVDRHHFAAGETPSLTLYGQDGNLLADGSYTWQLTAAPVTSLQRQAVAEARKLGKAVEPKRGFEGFTQSGSFAVSGGAFVVAAEGIGESDSGGPEKDQTIDDNVFIWYDLAVRGSGCFGSDCTVDEEFGYNDILLKENNTRIRFVDTSDDPDFPSNDWEISTNDRNAGGPNRFVIRDVDADPDYFGGVFPFTIEAGAGDNALYVDDQGNVGLGTATPEREIHITDNDSPALRLDQDGSGGFIPQTWDIIGNETGFYVRDITNEGLLPFFVEVGAPTHSLHVAADGNVGLGTENAQGSFHIENSSGNDEDDLVVDSTGKLGLGTDTPQRPIHIKTGQAHVAFENTNSGSRWNVGGNNDGSFVVSRNNSGSREFQIYENGDIYFRHGSQVLAVLDTDGNLTTTGTLTTGGTTCGGGCDLVFQPGYELETIEEHAAFMWENSYLPAVGPTLENGKAWNLTEKTGGMLNELEKAHIYIEQLNSKVGELSAELGQKDDLIHELARRLAQVEALLAAP